MNTELATTNATGDLATLESQALDQNPAAIYLAGLGASSRRTMKGTLDATPWMLTEGSDALSFPWARVRFQHVQAIRSKLEERYAPSTTNRYLSALRGALKSAWRLGQITAEEYHRAAGVQSVSGETLPAGRSIPQGEIYALMNACANDQTAAGVGDAAIIAILYACGLRRAQIVKLDVADYDRRAALCANSHFCLQ